MLGLQNCPMEQDTRKRDAVEAGERLQRVREAEGHPLVSTFIAELFGLDDAEDAEEIRRRGNTYEKWEAGINMVPRSFVGTLRNRTGVTADYIYYGDISGVDRDLKRKLLARERHSKIG